MGRTTICAAVKRYEPDFLLFASEAEIVALWGGVFLLFAGIALMMERRRLNRREINRVGWVPWTGIFVTLAVIGGGLLAVAVPGMLQG